MALVHVWTGTQQFGIHTDTSVSNCGAGDARSEILLLGAGYFSIVMGSAVT